MNKSGDYFNQNQLADRITAKIDNDPELNYETENVFSRCFNFFVASLLNIIPPKFGSFLINKTSKKAGEVKDKATTYYALDKLYITHSLSFDNGIFKGLAEYFWFKLGNPRAVRNRLKLVKKTLKEAIIDLVKNQKIKEISILSLGCGSARAVIETLHEIKKLGLNLGDFDVKLLDKDPEALTLSKVLISNHDLKECSFSFALDKIRNFNSYLNGINPNIIEMVGVLDYLGEEKAVEIFKKIHENLAIGGYFITANIKENRETLFVSKVIKWHMIYREPQNLIGILLAAGFKCDNIKIIQEPLKTHIVAICQK